MIRKPYVVPSYIRQRTSTEKPKPKLTSEQIQEQVNTFITKGGSIQTVEQGATGYNDGRTESQVVGRIAKR